MDNILFSILIPAYKTDFLYEAIDSILKQDYIYFEIIILDDCSPNPVGEIVRQFDNDKRIKYYRNQNNAGANNLVETWNKCLSLSVGDYIICMGDDDRLKSNCLSGYVKLISEHPGFDVYHGRTEIINENSIVTGLQEERPLYETVYSMMYYRWAGRIQFVGDFLYKSNNLKNKGGFYNLPMAWGSDDITSYIAAENKGIINSSEPLFQYRISSKTLSSSGNAELKLKAILGDEKWVKKFLKKKPHNQKDLYYWEQLNKLIKKNYSTKRKAAIYSDLRVNNLFHVFYWLGKRNKYSLSLTLIIRCFFVAISSSVSNLKNKVINS